MTKALLIANTGVQYVRIPNAFTFERASQFKRSYEVTPRTWARTEVVGGATADGDDDSPNRPVRASCKHAGEVLAEKSSLRSGNVWASHELLPLPMQGGRLWCSIAIAPCQSRLTDGQKPSYDVVIVIDTDLFPEENGSDELKDQLSILSLNRPLEIEPQSAEFWSHPLVRRLCDQAASGADGIQPEHIVSELCMLYGMLQELQGEGVLPTIAVAMPTVEEGCIPVDLVVDFGNSRTSAVLIEPSPSVLASQWPLRLSNKTDPFRIDEMPCPSDFAFLPPQFFKFARQDSAGRDLSTFRLISPVAFGRSARDLMDLSRDGLDRRGMSSPKRYVWDQQIRTQPWIYTQTPIESPEIVSSIVMAHINKNRPEEPIARRDAGNHGLQPDHPRSAGIILVVIELLEQAYREANSMKYRERYEKLHTRRRIANVVMMNPSSMPTEEVLRFEKLVTRALEIWRDSRANPSEFYAGRAQCQPADGRDRNRPQFVNACDEGMSIQACFVYSECARVFRSRSGEMIEIMGRTRTPHRPARVSLDPLSKKSLRIGAIDIGGGTIDLSIADYRSISAGAGAVGNETAFHVEQLFRDGFPSAGDDLIRHLLEQIVFPALAEGAKIDRAEWNRQLSDGGINDKSVIAIRKKLVDGVWIPLCHAILDHFETYPRTSFQRTVSDACYGRPSTPEDLDLLDKLFQLKAGTLRGTSILVTPRRVEEVLEGCWGTTLRLTCAVIGEYHCDLLLVGGRSATMPALISKLRLLAPVAPDRIKLLSGMRVDSWYPFAVNGRVGDAKTASVVGCGLFFKAKSAQLNFEFRQSTAYDPVEQFIGVLNEQDTPMTVEKDVFGNESGGETESQKSCVVVSNGSSKWIGVRRVTNPKAPSRPIYRLCRVDTLENFARHSPVVAAAQVRVQLEREAIERFCGSPAQSKYSDKLASTVGVVEGRLLYKTAANQPSQDWIDDPLQLKLQTRLEATYWIDQGQFHPLPDVLADES